MSNLLYDMILMEADKIAYHRQKDLELYYKDNKGEIVPLAEAYSPEVEDIIKQLSKRKRILFSILSTPPELTLFTKLSKTVTPPIRAFLTNLAAAAGSLRDNTAKVGQGEA